MFVCVSFYQLIHHVVQVLSHVLAQLVPFSSAQQWQTHKTRTKYTSNTHQIHIKNTPNIHQTRTKLLQKHHSHTQEHVKDVDVKYIDPSYMIRSVKPIATDAVYVRGLYDG